MKAKKKIDLATGNSQQWAEKAEALRKQVGSLLVENEHMRQALMYYANGANWRRRSEDGRIDLWMGEGHGWKRAKDVLTRE